jgi:dihydroorotase
MMTRTLLSNGVDTDGNSINILIDGERIAALSRDASQISAHDAEVIDMQGMTLAPTLVDLHTHLREPGKEDAETVQSGSASAVRGGFGAISAMPNTNPVADTAGVVEQVFSLGVEAGLCDVFPIGAVTVGQEGERLAEILAMAESRARVRIFSDDGHCVSDPVLMRRALEYVKIFDGVIAQHAQDPALTRGAQMNEGAVSARIGLKGWPAVAEEAIIARDVLLADHVGSRLHICHVSTAGSVAIIRWAKERGINVTAEVTPHHLLLTDELATTFDPVYKVNPPLRHTSDVMALREGLADGTIDVIATDHAPHPEEAKECEWDAAAFGMIGLETALAISSRAMVDSGLMSFTELIARMSSKPAEIAGYTDHIKPLEVGRLASLMVVDRDRKWQIDRELTVSRSKNTPFHGLEVGCYVHDVLYRGTWVMREGTVIK